MRGRKPKPTALKVLNGNPGKRPLNDREPIPEGNLGKPPMWMSKDQKAIWNHALKAAPPGLLKKLDASIFSVWVVASSLHEDAAKNIDAFGTVVRSPRGPVRSPYVAILNQQAGIMMKAASEMGFSPSSRSRVKVDSPTDRTDPFTGLMEIKD